MGFKLNYDSVLQWMKEKMQPTSIYRFERGWDIDFRTRHWSREEQRVWRDIQGKEEKPCQLNEDLF